MHPKITHSPLARGIGVATAPQPFLRDGAFDGPGPPAWNKKHLGPE